MIAIPSILEQLPDFAVLTLLALIQGLTEFLPVSSSGHLVLAQEAMGLKEPAIVVDVALHLGTLLAVFVVYRSDLLGIARDVLAGKLRELGVLVVGSVPAAVVGIGWSSELRAAFETPRYAAWGLFGTAMVLLVGEAARRRHPRPEVAAPGEGEVEEKSPGFRVALLIGIAQAFAIWPGISRSGSTIAMGLLCGLSPRRAARFSFLLSIPAILGAAILGLSGAIGEDVLGGGTSLLWAAAFAGFGGWGALRLLLAFLARGAFAWFAVYCAVLGAGYLAFA